MVNGRPLIVCLILWPTKEFLYYEYINYQNIFIWCMYQWYCNNMQNKQFNCSHTRLQHFIGKYRRLAHTFSLSTGPPHFWFRFDSLHTLWCKYLVIRVGVSENTLIFFLHFWPIKIKIIMMVTLALTLSYLGTWR